jgi:hypothetical protein
MTTLPAVLLILVNLLGSGSPAEAELPPLDAQSLGGEQVTPLRDTRGQGAVLVVGFSKGAAKLTKPWMDACLAALAASGGGGITCYDVRMVEEVPRLFRGAMERGMRKGLPIERQRLTLLVYSGNEAWRQRLGVKDDDAAYVIGCDREGHVRRAATGPYSEGELQAILAAIR